MAEVKLLQGNEACVEGALLAGVNFYAGYPITPSSEVAEGFAEQLPLRGGVFVQMEDEIGSMAAVIGAAMAGRKALTATSGPGFSLKQENIGYAAMIEAPCVIVNVQRTGPSTGLPTSPGQGDVMQSKWGSHGDRPVISICPTSVEETLHYTIQAVNWSEKFRTPVVLLLDEVVGHMREKITVPDPEELTIVARKRPEVGPGDYQPYALPEGSLIPPLPDYGTGYRFHTTGLFHDETGFPTNKPEVTGALIKRLLDKVSTAEEELTLYETYRAQDAEYLIISYGATARSAREICTQARERGKRVGLLILKTLWPFPYKLIAQLSEQASMILVPEMNMGQVVHEVERAVAGAVPVRGIHRADGMLITPDEIGDRLEGGL